MPREVTVACENPRRKPREIIDSVEVVEVVEPPCGCAKPEADFSKLDASGAVVRDVAKYAAVLELAKTVGYIDDDRKIYELLRTALEKEDQEVFVVLGVDSHGSLRICTEVARGQRDRVAVAVKDILRPVLLDGCCGFAVVHNHPAGEPSPSEADKALTKRLREAASVMNLVFLDHLVVGLGRYYSFSDNKTKKA
jgi:DNA repair protein RadC